LTVVLAEFGIKLETLSSLKILFGSVSVNKWLKKAVDVTWRLDDLRPKYLVALEENKYTIFCMINR
jgi:hypothetical protein